MWIRSGIDLAKLKRSSHLAQRVAQLPHGDGQSDALPYSVASKSKDGSCDAMSKDERRVLLVT
jgi:hypothetical protein